MNNLPHYCAVDDIIECVYVPGEDRTSDYFRVTGFGGTEICTLRSAKDIAQAIREARDEGVKQGIAQVATAFGF